jgi:lysozyme
MNRAILKISLVGHEGRRDHPYDDKTGRELRSGDKLVGKLTIGVGRNLTDRGLRNDEIALLLNNDIDEAVTDAMRLVPSFVKLADARQRVLVELVFNLGGTKLARFKNFLAAIDAGDFDRAADEMLNSKWHIDVGARARTLARLMRDG